MVATGNSRAMPSNKVLTTAGKRAGLDNRLCHPHALRHAAGHALANKQTINAHQLQAVMGHKDARSTATYVACPV
jgi:integrase